MNKKETICIIPARGGSKGVHKKNIRLIRGRPLIDYTIKATLDSGVVDRIFISTDDEDIAKVAIECGAEVIKRPDELAGDKITLEPVIKHAIDFLKTEEDYVPEIISVIQPTSPLLKAEIIKKSVKKVKNEGFDSSITAFIPDTYEWKWTPKEGSKGDSKEYVPEVPVMSRVVRQDLPEVLHENGAYYVTKLKEFEKNGHRWGGKMAVVEMSEEDSIQIDSEYQLWLIDKILEKRENEK